MKMLIMLFRSRKILVEIEDMAQHGDSGVDNEGIMLTMQTHNQATWVNNNLQLQVLERRGMLKFYIIHSR